MPALSALAAPSRAHWFAECIPAFAVNGNLGAVSLVQATPVLAFSRSGPFNAFALREVMVSADSSREVIAAGSTLHEIQSGKRKHGCDKYCQ